MLSSLNQKMKKILSINLLYAIISGVLLSLGWCQPLYISWIMFVALVPIFFVFKDLSSKGQLLKLVGISGLSLLIFNVLTTYWIYYASPEGAIMAFVFNTLLMCFPFLLGAMVYKKISAALGWIMLFAGILGLEYLHLNWEAPWPWLNLGNSLANSVHLIQWYEFTGVAGGSLWIVVVNYFIFKIITHTYQFKKIVLWGASVMTIPIIISLVIFYSLPYAEQEDWNIVVVQPNIDPYTEKFNTKEYKNHVKNMIELAEQQVDDKTQLVMLPETALPEEIDEQFIHDFDSYQLLLKFAQEHPQINILTGISSYRIFNMSVPKTFAARESKFLINKWYEVYNTALLFDAQKKHQWYHKIKLVPGVETMPFVSSFGFLNGLILDLGGTSGTLGHNDKPENLELNNHKKISPVICYESVFGEFVTDFIKQKSDIITIITNDGWWKNTAGMRHHYHYAKIRAIENRTQVARSANTGISGFINAKGITQIEAKAWEKASIKHNYEKPLKSTFYSIYGDLIYRYLAVPIFLILLLSIPLARFFK